MYNEDDFDPIEGPTFFSSSRCVPFVRDQLVSQAKPHKAAPWHKYEMKLYSRKNDLSDELKLRVYQTSKYKYIGLTEIPVNN